MKAIRQHISTGMRHKLLFTSHYPEGMVFVDMGASLAKSIDQSLLDRHLPMIADEAVESIIKDYVTLNEEIGEYVAIRNIGILFEPSFHLDLHAKFSAWSKAYTLIVDAAEGVIKNDVFYLAGIVDKSYSINLSDIPYKTYYDEI